MLRSRAFIVLAITVASCARPPTAPPATTQSFLCASAARVSAAARALRDAGHLRAAVPEVERADAMCRDSETWAARRDVYEALGRADALRALMKEIPDVAGKATSQAALDRVGAMAHGVEAADVLVRAAHAQANPAQARATFDRAIDELERSTHVKGQRLTQEQMRALDDPSQAPMEVIGDGRWIHIGLGGGIIVRTDSWSAFSLDADWTDDTGAWAWVHRAPRADGDAEELWNLDEVARVLDDARVPTEQHVLADGLLMWVEEDDDTLHVFDRKLRTERRRPLGSLTTGSMVISGGEVWWSTESSVHAFDPKTDQERVYTESGKHLTAFMMTADGGDRWSAFAWEHGPVVVRHGAAEVLRVKSDTSSIAFDAPRRVAWLDDASQSFVVVDLATRAQRKIAVLPSHQDFVAAGCGGAQPSRIVGLSKRGLLARCESGDVGSEILYDLGSGRPSVSNSWNPGDEYQAVMSNKELCAKTHLDCGKCDDDGCGAVHDAQAGVVVVDARGRAFRVDATTGATIVELAGGSASPIRALASNAASPFVLDIGDLLRAWDARDGRLVWSVKARSFCRFGVRLYAPDLCE